MSIFFILVLRLMEDDGGLKHDYTNIIENTKTPFSSFLHHLSVLSSTSAQTL